MNKELQLTHNDQRAKHSISKKKAYQPNKCKVLLIIEGESLLTHGHPFQGQSQASQSFCFRKTDQ